MKTQTEKLFLKWATAHGMGLDERYPDSAVLTFKPNPDFDRFWIVPSQPERRPFFLLLMLELMGKWESCFVWRHMGSWPSSDAPERSNSINSRVESQILSGLKLPMGTADIVQFDRSEVDSLVTLLFSTTVFGWSVSEDLYVVPDHAQYIVKLSHHDAIHVSFRNEETLHEFVKGMREQKFPLPEKVPDGTFKQPSWMKKSSNTDESR